MFLKYNLQFFAEGEENGDGDDTIINGSSGDSDSVEDKIDMQAFADIISEKDKQIEELQKDIAELKKSNANLIVKVNAAANPPEQKKSFEETLLNMVGAKPRKE